MPCSNNILLKIVVNIKNKYISKGKNDKNKCLKISPINCNKKSKNISKSTKFSNIEKQKLEKCCHNEKNSYLTLSI